MIWFLKRGNGFNKIKKHESRCLGCSPCVELIGPRAVCLDLSAWAVQGTTFLNQAHAPSLARTHCARLILKAPVRNKAGPSPWHRCCNAVETATHHCTQDHPKRSLGRISRPGRHQLFQRVISHLLLQTPGHLEPNFHLTILAAGEPHLKVCISVYLPYCQICFPALTYPLV